MHRTPFELMRNHVREMHQALTGEDLPDTSPPATPPPAALSADGVIRLFTALEAVVRTLPGVAERVPPFSFAPPMDLLEDDRELIAELAVPGVEKDDVLVELHGDTLSISGALERGAGPTARLRHAEIARGPFWRVLQLPQPVSGTPRVEVRGGLVRIQLTKQSPQSTQSTRSERGSTS